jgi:LemA protein
MSNDKQYLQAYMDKMLEVQKQREEQYFTPNELKEIAISVGLSEADWAASQQLFEKHISVGQGHLNATNYTAALYQFEEALKLNPSHERALFGAASAAHELYLSTQSTAFAKKSTDYANRVLQNEDAKLDSKAINLLKSIRTADGQYASNRERRRWIMAAIAAATIAFFLVAYLVLKNSLNASYHEVEKQWAQVENVCQRKADLIPKLISISQAQSGQNQATIDKLQALQKELPTAKGDPEAYAKAQTEINKLLNQVLEEVGAQAGTTEGSLKQQYNDLRAQIEGAENRISVERKRYNEAVADYNSQNSQFPYSLIGKPMHQYFRPQGQAK